MKKIKDCFILGTRPEILKFDRLIEKLNPFTIYTGQQIELRYDANMKFDIDLCCTVKKNQTQADYLSSLIKNLDLIIKERKPERIWVEGDTTSAYAGAIVAKLNKIKLVHLEAGLRTYDNTSPFPEEIYRVAIDHMADILFAPTKLSLQNLKNELVTGDCYLTGNTIVDELEWLRKELKNFPNRPIEEKYVLATVHRRESFGKDMIEIFKALKKLSKTIKVILPEHTNPRVKEAIKKVGLKTVEHMHYAEFIWYLAHCEYVLSDSGGVQEEAPSFGKKVIILRKKTERQELVDCGYGILIDKMECNYILKKIKEFSEKKVKINRNPFGSGDSADIIVKIIKKLDGK